MNCKNPLTGLYRTFTRTTALFGLAVLPLAGATLALIPAPVHAAVRDGDEEVTGTQKSKVVAFDLPENTYRFNGKDAAEKFAGVLKQMAKGDGAKVGKVEVLVWVNSRSAMKEVPKRLKAAGYNYTARETVEDDGTKMTPFVAQSEEEPNLYGIWAENEGNLVLAWAKAGPKEGAAKKPATEKTASKTGDVEREDNPADAPKGRTAGGVPADMTGKWSWTTISSVNYQDTITKRLAEPSGMSVTFSFTRDGRYTKFFYVRQRTYSLVTEATTTEEGTVKFLDNGTFVLTIEKGHYKGNTGSRLIDRDMTREERNKPATYSYEWRTENGKRVLYIGPSEKSLSQFKRAE